MMMRLLVAGTGHMIDISIGSTIVLLFAESSLLRQQALEIYSCLPLSVDFSSLSPTLMPKNHRVHMLGQSMSMY